MKIREDIALGKAKGREEKNNIDSKVFSINLDWALKTPVTSDNLHLGKIDKYDITLCKSDDNTRYIIIHYPLHISI